MAEFGHLLKSQMAAVGRLVGASGLDPSEFKWGNGGDAYYEVIPELRHEPTRFRFRFTAPGPPGFPGIRTEGTHAIKFTPGASQEWEEHFYLAWETVLDHVDAWLRNVKRELTAETFWEAATLATRGLAGQIEGQRDTAFVKAEIASIDELLGDIVRRVNALEGIQEAQRDFVRREFDELKSQLRSMKRRGWAKLALGTFVNLSVREIVPQDAVRDLWTALMRHLSSLPGLLPPGT